MNEPKCDHSCFYCIDKFNQLLDEVQSKFIFMPHKKYRIEISKKAWTMLRKKYEMQ